MRCLLLLGQLVTICLVCGGCTTGGNNQAPGIRNFGQVTPEVWRGGKPDRQGMQWLAERGVKTIIDLQMQDESSEVPAGVKYVPVRTSMWQCDAVDVDAVVKAIDQSPKPVFIHCLVGRDRTGLAIAAWRMSHGASADEAIAQMERFGSNPWWDGAIKRRIRRLEQERKISAATQESPKNP